MEKCGTPTRTLLSGKLKKAVKTNELDENILFRQRKGGSIIDQERQVRKSVSGARHNEVSAALMYGIEEGWFDRMASLRILQECHHRRKGCIPDKGNAYMLENSFHHVILGLTFRYLQEPC